MFWNNNLLPSFNGWTYVKRDEDLITFMFPLWIISSSCLHVFGINWTNSTGGLPIIKWFQKKSKILIGESLGTKDWNYRSWDKINDLCESTYKWTIYCYQLLTYPPQLGHIRQFSLLRTGRICTRFKPNLPSLILCFFLINPSLFSCY